MGIKNKKAYTDTAWNFLHFESTVHGTRYRKGLITLTGQRFHKEKSAHIKTLHRALLWKYEFYEHVVSLQGDWEVLQCDSLKVTEGNHWRQM